MLNKVEKKCPYLAQIKASTSIIGTNISFCSGRNCVILIFFCVYSREQQNTATNNYKTDKHNQWLLCKLTVNFNDEKNSSTHTFPRDERRLFASCWIYMNLRKNKLFRVCLTWSSVKRIFDFSIAKRNVTGSKWNFTEIQNKSKASLLFAKQTRNLVLTKTPKKEEKNKRKQSNCTQKVRTLSVTHDIHGHTALAATKMNHYRKKRRQK